MKPLRAHPYRVGMMIWWLFIIIFSLICIFWVRMFWVIDILLALNAAAFSLYGIDKLFAQGHLYRIPERILWLSAFMGGPVGALFGMYVFHHKVSKNSFKLALSLVILLELVLVLFVLDRLQIVSVIP